jgi:hypothetical protein
MSTKANGRPFSIVQSRTHADQWDVDIRPHRHNHPLSRSAAVHPSLRRIDIQAAVSTVDTLASVGTRPNRIYSAVLQLKPTSSFTSRDLYNTFAKTRRKKRGGLTNIEALVKLLEDDPDTWIIETLFEAGDLKALFFLCRAVPIVSIDS